jgi:hypothetical protein
MRLARLRVLEAFARRACVEPLRVTRVLKGKRDQNSSLVELCWLSGVTREDRADVVGAALRTVEGNRALGCFVGLAVADFIGVPLEFAEGGCAWDAPGFKHSGTLFPLLQQGRAPTHLGQWSDDTSMALCLADSLLLNRGRFDGSNTRILFWNW